MSELRESIGRFLVASSMKRSDQPDTPYIKVMGPTVADLERVLAAARLVADGKVVPVEDIDYEAATRAMTAKLKDHPIPAPSFGGTAEPAMFWGVSVGEVARVAVDAALHLEGTE